MIDPKKLRAIILSAARDDWTGLYEVMWELNTLHPKTPYKEKLRVSIGTLEELLSFGALKLASTKWVSGQYHEVPVEKRLSIVRDPECWQNPMYPRARFYAFAITAVGDELYRSLPPTDFEGIWQ